MSIQQYIDDMEWDRSDRDWLIRHWARKATAGGTRPSVYFNALVSNADFSDEFRFQLSGRAWDGDPRGEAAALFDWAISRGINPKDARYTTIASILVPSLPEVGADQAAKLAALIVKYKLIVGRKTAEAFARRYQIPLEADRPAPNDTSGPDFAWKGPDDEETLQGLFRATPIELDVEFLTRAIAAASAVCRVEIDVKNTRETEIRGTGFLIAANLVLTNYHVLGSNDDEVSAAASKALLRFGALTNLDEGVDQGQVARVSSILERSPISKNDFVLLQADTARVKGLQPVQLGSKLPASGSGLHILHHPRGGPMKLCVSRNGMTNCLTAEGKFQYVSQTFSGSSGSPCFDDKFEVIGIHQAVRSKFSGSVGQGIMIDAVRENLAGHIDN